MSKKFLTNIDLNTNELQNAVIQKVASDPTTNLISGRIIYNTTSNEFKYYNGTAWVSSGGLTGVTSVANGGTGLSSIPAGEVMIGAGTSSVQTKPIDSSVTAGSTNLITSGAVAVALNAITAMQFKGTIGADGTISSSDIEIDGSNFTELTSYKLGWCFTASANIPTTVINLGTALEAGDMILTLADATSYSASNFTAIQANTDGHVTGPSASVDGNIVVFDGVSGKFIKDGGTIADAVAHTHTITAGVGLTGGGEVAIGETVTITLSDTGVVSGVYSNNVASTLEAGSTFTVPKITVDDQGRITNAQSIEFTVGEFGKKYTIANPTLTSTGGVCTWNVTHSLNTTAVNTVIYDNTTHNQVFADVVANSVNQISILINSTTDIEASSYTVVVFG